MSRQSEVAPKIPGHLSKEMRKWVQSIIDAYILEPHDFAVLVKAAESWDRCEQARKVLSKHGTSYLDRFGAPRNRPEVAIERDSRIAFIRAIAALNLSDEEPVESETRPRTSPRIGERR